MTFFCVSWSIIYQIPSFDKSWLSFVEVGQTCIGLPLHAKCAVPTDIKNLWPEPQYGTYTASMKDKLENRLHKLVCDGTMSLSQAQTQIASNWIKMVLN